MIRIITAHNILKDFFGVFACADIYFLKNRSQKPQIRPKMAISLF